MNPASVETSVASKLARPLCICSETSVRLIRESPHLHSAIDDNVDACHVRARVRGEEQCDVHDLLRPTEATEERLAEHVAGPFGVFQLFSSLIGFDHTR